MTSVTAGRAALESGQLDTAQSIFLTTYDSAPGESSRGLAEVSFARGEFQRAENLARTAMENGEESAIVVVAEAIGAQGRRAEAEQVAEAASRTFSKSGYARFVLGEQIIRQGRWEEGARHFALAFALDQEGLVGNLQRLLSDLAEAHKAGKVPSERVLTFLGILEQGTSSVPLTRTLAAARHAVDSGSSVTFDRTPIASAGAPSSPPPSGPVPPAPPGPPPPPAARPAQGSAQGSAPATRNYVQRNLPGLLDVMKRDRELNRELEAMVAPLGLPMWPSKIATKLDTLPALQPKRLGFTQERLKRTTLKLTSGSVASGILIGRALESLLRATERGSATRPQFDAVGMTKLEIALWDGALQRLAPVADVYGEVGEDDFRVLALGAFLGDGILRLTDSTWRFERDPIDSEVEVAGESLNPFAPARRWLTAADWDDVHLEEVVGRALMHGAKPSQGTPRIDPTRDLEGKALSRKLAEQWMTFRGHPPEVTRTDVEQGVRPLNVLDEVIFLACDRRFVPAFACGTSDGAVVRDEVCLAFMRRSGEFLCLGSRKHFARAVGQVIGRLTQESVQMVLDMFGSFHRPNATVVGNGSEGPRLQRGEKDARLAFTAGGRRYVFQHTPREPIQWRLTSSE